MLELATLGLLTHKPLHGYRLKQQLEQFMSGWISVNYGSIYPLLRRLERDGLVQTLPAPKPPAPEPRRKVYAITPKGQQYWREQILDHPYESWVNGRTRFMVKFFFFEQIAPIERVQLLEHRLAACRRQLEVWTGQGKSWIIRDYADNPYAQQVRQWDLDNLHLEIQWLEKNLAQEQQMQQAESMESQI
ncbi:PadR family transcriptional regulator [Alkalinema sp. FACHB-956]|uniref:PadR family transcriptional regulator n=1 Tax=Alkalinema sp. FACHB-956 TaxID=2692768 RepID=UPI0016843C15|nr:PadR family transcriptional regulator [Alkalinema sp. FACHB-956]MBD2327001.1 PadR family transcriptional regulator [Alkalinema sp. FACHB-956]